MMTLASWYIPGLRMAATSHRVDWWWKPLQWPSSNMADVHCLGTESPLLMSMACMWMIFGPCVVQHIGHYMPKALSETWCPQQETNHQNMTLMKTIQFSSGLHLGIECFSYGPYFDGWFLVVDITFRSAKCPICEQHVWQIPLTYMPYLHVNRGGSVPKWCESAILDEGHCSGLHQSTWCGHVLNNCPILTHWPLGDFNSILGR